MSDNLTISKPTGEELRITSSYEELRALGISYIENLGSDFWTDYNIHDPGITIKEMLCYALTDLDYRTAYPIRDILALEEGDYYFHSARTSLTMNPVTINDYRKLLINVEGVKNSWLIMADTLETDYQEIEFGVDLDEREFTYNLADAESLIKLRGLYKVLLEFEESEEFGDLNQQTLTRPLRIAGEDTELELVFPTWRELIELPAGDGELAKNWVELGVTLGIDFDSATLVFDADRKGYLLPLSIDFKYTPKTPPPDPGFVCFKDLPVPPPPPLPPSEINASFELPILIRYEGLLSDLANPAVEDFFESLEPNGIIAFYHGMMKEIFSILNDAHCALMEHRNLCEDFLDVDSLETEDIGICADIEVKPDADIEEILAEAWFRIGEFISPTINFYTLQEMTEKGLTMDQIFNGPPLDHGFILDSELDASILRIELHTSDFINIIMDIPGVVAVRNFLMVNYIDGIAQTEGEKWVLKLINDNHHVARLNTGLSSIGFFRDILPVQPNMDEVEDLLREKKARLVRGRLTGIDLDLPIPVGKDLDIESYSTIQNQFPLTYGIGQDGIPGAPDDLRKAQARQLKGFLLFFDQILANYLAQLNGVRKLFSMDPAEEQKTYFVQAVKDIKDVESLYDFYGAGWNSVEQKIYEISETTEEYEERKNRFLSHLIARFAESFAEYSLLMYALKDEVAPEELIRDKHLFLIDYPIISGDRFKAYNYRPKNLATVGLEACEECDPSRLWTAIEIDNTEPTDPEPISSYEPVNEILPIEEQMEKDRRVNVSGFKKRVSRLLGIESFDRTNLTCHCFSVRKINYTTRDDVWIWEFTDPELPNEVLLRSIEYETEEAAMFMVSYAIVMIEENRLKPEQPPLLDTSCCKKVEVESPDGTSYMDEHIVLLNPCDTVIACSPDPFPSDDDRILAYNRIIRYVNARCNVEGFHLVEHILLRPRTTDDHFFTACLGEKEVAIIPGATEESNTRQGTELFFEIFTDVQGQWRFRVRNEEGRIILRSENYYNKISGCQNGIKAVKRYSRDFSNFQLKVSRDGRYYFNIVAANNEIVGASMFYKTKQDRQGVINDLIGTPEAGRMGARVSGMEEEITNIGPLYYCPDEIDPYSFRISIVLPSWARRFRNVNFRKLVERTLRMEAPAHVALRICWIDRWQMADFECALKDWVFALGRCEPDQPELTGKQNNLIYSLEHLQNIYPVATLHDCEESGDDTSPVILNNTSLGSL